MEVSAAILEKMVKAQNIDMSYEAMLYISSHLGPSPEKLKQALIRVVAYSSLVNRDIDADLAAEALHMIPQKPEGTTESLSMKNVKKSLAYASIFAIVSIGSFALLSGCSSNKTITHSSNVAMAEAKQGGLQQDITLSGRAEPFQQISLTPSIEGNIKDIFVELGVYVKKGQKIAQLNDKDLAYRIKQAEAHVNSVQLEAKEKAIDQQISLNQSKVSLTANSTSDVDVAKSVVQDAELALADAQKNWERTNNLFQVGAIPQQQMDQANSQKRSAEIQLENAKKLVVSKTTDQNAQRQSAMETSQLQSESKVFANQLTQQEIEQAKADLDLIKYQFNNLALVAPINGFVTSLGGKIGDAVSPANPLFVITNLDKLSIKIDVPEALINRLKMGQTAMVKFPMVGREIEGKITYIGLLADTSKDNATYPVKVLVDNTKHEVKGGMLAQVTFN